MSKIIHIGYLLIIAVLAIQAWPQTVASAASAVALPNTANALQQSLPLSLASNAQSSSMRDVSSEVTSRTSVQQQHAAQLDELRALERRKQQLLVQRSEAYPQRMRIEPRNSEWALKMENNFIDAMITDERLRNLPFIDVHCRSAICSVTFSANLPEPSEHIHQMLRALRQYQWYQEFNHSSFSEFLENDVYTIYLERTQVI